MDEQALLEPGTETSQPATPLSTPKRRPWLMPVIAVLVVALAGGGYFVWTGMQAKALAAARAQAADDAETHWEAAMTALGAIERGSEALKITDATDAATSMPSMATSLEAMQKTAGKELDGMEAAVALLSDGEAKTDYKTALTAARDAVAMAVTAVPTLQAAPAYVKQAASIDKAIIRVRDQINLAVKAGNSKKWSTAISRASKAQSICTSAKSTLNKMKNDLMSETDVSDGGGMSLAQKVMSTEMTMAKSTLAAARAGRSGSYATYNSQIKRYNNAMLKLNKLTEPAFLLVPMSLADRAVSVLKSSGNLVSAARDAHEKALKASIVR